MNPKQPLLVVCKPASEEPPQNGFLFSDEALKNISALARVLREIRQDLIKDGVDIEAHQKFLVERRKTIDQS